MVIETASIDLRLEFLPKAFHGARPTGKGYGLRGYSGLSGRGYKARTNPDGKTNPNIKENMPAWAAGALHVRGEGHIQPSKIGARLNNRHNATGTAFLKATRIQNPAIYSSECRRHLKCASPELCKRERQQVENRQL